MDARHVPVLLSEIISYLNPKPGQHFLDMTLGDGGHAEAILKATAPNGKLLGIDLDPAAVKRAGDHLTQYKHRITLKQENYRNIGSIIHEYPELHPICGILLDLGVSSPQLGAHDRGFSFQVDGQLDMRYDPAQSTSVADIVNAFSKDQLTRIFEEYGQERLAREIAQKIVEKRKTKQFQTTGQLLEVILLVYRDRLHSKKEIPWIGGIHPATKTFQALRIAVNDELTNLEKTLPQLPAIVQSGGRIAVISFHSLEDKIIKTFFCTEEQLKIITKHVIKPRWEEMQKNPRARSAHLRVAEKL